MFRTSIISLLFSAVAVGCAAPSVELRDGNPVVQVARECGDRRADVVALESGNCSTRPDRITISRAGDKVVADIDFGMSCARGLDLKGARLNAFRHYTLSVNTFDSEGPSCPCQYRLRLTIYREHARFPDCLIPVNPPRLIREGAPVYFAVDGAVVTHGIAPGGVGPDDD